MPEPRDSTCTATHLGEVFRTSLRLLSGRFEFLAAQLWEVGPHGQEATLRAEEGLRDVLEAISPRGREMAREILDKKAPSSIVFSEVAGGGEHSLGRALVASGVRAVWAIALGEPGRPSALLVIYLQEPLRPEPAMEDFLEAMAAQASLALEVGECCQDLRAKFHQMQAGVGRWAALAELAVGQTHDFNNALGLILGNAHVLRSKLGSTEEALRALDVIEGAVLDAAEKVRHLQGLKSNIAEGPRVRPVDLNNLAEEVLQLMREKFKGALVEGVTIELQKDLGSRLPIRANPVLLREALLSVLLSSFHPLPRGGKITLRTWQDLQAVHLSVSDTGTKLSRAFGRGRMGRKTSPPQEPAEALGLDQNVATACDLIRSQQGELVVRTEKGMGTTVTITFPKASYDAPSSDSPVAHL